MDAALDEISKDGVNIKNCNLDYLNTTSLDYTSRLRRFPNAKEMNPKQDIHRLNIFKRIIHCFMSLPHSFDVVSINFLLERNKIFLLQVHIRTKCQSENQPGPGFEPESPEQ